MDQMPQSPRRRKSDNEPIETARLQLVGPVKEEIDITADKGYVLWIQPSGSLDITFKYADSGYDFWLHVDPQFRGVKIEDVTNIRKPQLIYNGKDDLRPSDGVRLGNGKYTQDNTFKFRSTEAVVKLRLDTLEDREKYSDAINAFRINYTMTL